MVSVCCVGEQYLKEGHLAACKIKGEMLMLHKMIQNHFSNLLNINSEASPHYRQYSDIMQYFSSTKDASSKLTC